MNNYKNKQNKTYSYIYKITNNINNEFYIGLRSCNCLPKKDNYYGSGIRITRSIKKYGKEKFTKEILMIFNNRKDASNYEQLIVNEQLLKNSLCLNLKTGGEYINGVTYSKEVSKKISESLIEYYSDPKNRNKKSIEIKNMFDNNPELKLYLSEKRKEVAKRPEHIEKVRKIRKKQFEDKDFLEKFINAINTPEAKKKKSDSMKAYLNTDKGKENISNATKNSVYMNDGKNTKRVQEDKVDEYFDMGWVKGSLLEVSKETKGKIGKIFSNRIWIKNIKLKSNKRVLENELEDYLQNGWELGYKRFKKDE